MEFGSDRRLDDPAFGDSHCQLVKRIRRVVEADAIHLKEDDGREQPCALISIDKRVVTDDVEKVRCCHREQPLVGGVARERCLRLRDCRFKQAPIAKTRSAAKDIELGCVKFKDVLNVKKQDLVSVHLASFRNVSS